MDEYGNSVCMMMLCTQDVVFNFLTTDDIQLNQIDAEDPEVSRHYTFNLLLRSYCCFCIIT